MIEKTKELLEKGIKTIYEAAFAFDDLLVICDILHFNGDGWNIYEVKSSTKVKERHIDDITFQYYVAKENIQLSSVNIVHINNKYSRDKELHVHELFSIVNKTDDIIGHFNSIPEDVSTMKSLLANTCPKQDIGSHCKKYKKDTFECGAINHCWAHIPEYSIFNISRIGKKAFDLHNKSILTLDDIPDDYKLSETQKFQVEAYKSNKTIIDRDKIKEFISTIKYPLYFLDFESYQQTIPLFKNIKPYEQIPFQYSLHYLENAESTLKHKDFLGKEGTDPRRALAERLINDIPENVCTIAYNMSFEKMILRNLCELYPDLKEQLMNIHDNMLDLMIPFQKKWYYTNDMNGSYSIKYVLPALFPNDESLNYKNLNIQNGSMAMDTFEFLHELNTDEIQSTRKDLLAYCKLDTYAMVKIYEFLYNFK